MGLHILAEAILRLEHKVDQLLRHFKVKSQSMQFFDNRCSICEQPVQYQIDLQHNVVKRKCSCSTGKQPSTIPLVTPGVSNGNEGSPEEREVRTTTADDSSRRGHRRSR